MWRHFLSFLTPSLCPICRRVRPALAVQPVCPACWPLLQPLGHLICQRCGDPLKDGGDLCYRCEHTPLSLNRVRAALPYDMPVSRLIHAFKYEGRSVLSRTLAIFLADHPECRSLIRRARVLIPIPLHPKTLRKRGFNQTERLAQDLGHYFQKPVLSHALIRVRSTTPQAGLRKAERLLNMTGAFEALSPEKLTLPPTSPILLIDDVCTTAATLEAAAQALLRQGFRDVSAVCAARD